MHVLRLLRIFIPLLIVAAIVAGIVLVATSRSDLQRSRKQVNTAWIPLRGALDARYATLNEANKAVDAVPGPLNQIVTQVTAQYTHWRDLLQHHGSVTAEVDTANSLESLGRRLVISARRAPRLAGDAAALGKVNGYAGLALPASAANFDTAVAGFERTRNKPAHRIAARILGYGSIPAYDMSGTS
jgi:hypothetical protein